MHNITWKTLRRMKYWHRCFLNGLRSIIKIYWEFYDFQRFVTWIVVTKWCSRAVIFEGRMYLAILHYYTWEILAEITKALCFCTTELDRAVTWRGEELARALFHNCTEIGIEVRGIGNAHQASQLNMFARSAVSAWDRQELKNATLQKSIIPRRKITHLCFLYFKSGFPMPAFSYMV